MMDDGTQRTSLSGKQSTEFYLLKITRKQANTNHSSEGKIIESNDSINFCIFSFFEVIKFSGEIYSSYIQYQDSKNNSIYLRAGNMHERRKIPSLLSKFNLFDDKT